LPDVLNFGGVGPVIGNCSLLLEITLTHVMGMCLGRNAKIVILVLTKGRPIYLLSVHHFTLF
jgi:hypothetical protein